MLKLKSLSPLTIVIAGSFALVLGLAMATSFRKAKSADSGHAVRFFDKSNKIGVLEIRGPIMESKKIIEKLNYLNDEDAIRGIVVRIDSPGGSVGPSQEIYEAVKKIKKPTAVSMGAVAASGGYYIAVASPLIFANPGTITGSIGVIMQFMNLEKLYDWAKVKRFSIKTGKFKDFGAEYREMTVEEKAYLQTVVDDGLLQFKAAIMAGRKMTADTLDPIADGRIFTGQQALGLKLVDRLGTLQDAVEEVAKVAKIKGTPRLVYPESSKRSILEFLMDSQSDDEESESSSSSGVFGLLKGFLQRPSVQPRPGLYWLWQGPA